MLGAAVALYLSADSITVYTPYSTTTVRSLSALDDSYYVVSSPVLEWAALGCCLGGILLMAVGIFCVRGERKSS